MFMSGSVSLYLKKGIRMNSSVLKNAQADLSMFVARFGQAFCTILLVVMAFFLCSGVAEAATTTTTGTGNEFNSTANKFMGWVQGGLGKTAALVGLGVGMMAAAATKDYKWLALGLVIAIVAGVLPGIIGSSFTAII